MILRKDILSEGANMILGLLHLLLASLYLVSGLVCITLGSIPAIEKFPYWDTNRMEINIAILCLITLGKYGRSQRVYIDCSLCQVW